MKHVANIAGIVLGALFVMAGVTFFVKAPPPMPADGSAASHFMAALLPTGYMAFVKVFEIAGGLCVAIPRLRPLGLLLLGPVIVNIIAFHVFISRGAGLLDPMLLVMTAIFLFLLWRHRGLLAALVTRPPPLAGAREAN